MLGNMASHFQKPFIVFCETYKLSNRSQLDSFSWNELLNPEGLLGGNKHGDDNFIGLNLRWDLTPIKFIKMVIFFFYF